MKIIPSEIPVPKLHGYLLSAVAPRPIGFASTVDKNGNVNLSPFSFFNVFSANPPVLIFSPARRGRDNTTKHTYENVMQHPEVVINMVSYDIVEQMSLASTEYGAGVNEFVKAGFTEIPSEMVKPPRVKESPVSLECEVMEVKQLGENGGAGNLVICEVKIIHINDDVLDENQNIDPNKIKLVARMGANWYSKAFGDGIFEIEKPLITKGVGVDAVPQFAKDSGLFSGNHLGRLGNTETLPTEAEIATFSQEKNEKNAVKLLEMAVQSLDNGDHANAWKAILLGQRFQ